MKLTINDHSVHGNIFMLWICNKTITVAARSNA
jgi:hypothetical protein